MGMINPLDRPPLQADSNLSYLQFIAVVKKLWEESHPSVPVVPVQGPQFAAYPVVTYNLDIRRPHQDEPKRKFREQVTSSGGTEVRLIYGQRFVNVVRFTAIDPNPQKAEEIVEAFEDFMVEYTPVFKRVGASELIYARRYQDNDGNQPGEDVARRSVAYQLTTEKLYETVAAKLDQIIIDLRMFIENNELVIPNDHSATPIGINITDLYQSATPATPLI